MVHPLLMAVCVAVSLGDGALDGDRWMGMPSGNVFDPLLADTKTPQTLGSVLWAHSVRRPTLVGVVAVGDDIGLVRWPGATAVQLGISGGVFSQFDLRKASLPLLNADYTVGVPITVRRGAWSARGRVYHQSSHLGDEYLIAEQLKRLNLSFEALELLTAVQRSGARLYAGGEWIFRPSPSSLPALVWHAGLDYRHPRTFRVIAGTQAQLVAGIDVKRSWSSPRTADVSLRAGVEVGPAVGREDGWRRRFALLGQYYEGNAPYGQFFSENVSFAGIGIHFFL
jgi:hypothetical protein